MITIHPTLYVRIMAEIRRSNFFKIISESVGISVNFLMMSFFCFCFMLIYLRFQMSNSVIFLYSPSIHIHIPLDMPLNFYRFHSRILK